MTVPAPDVCGGRAQESRLWVRSTVEQEVNEAVGAQVEGPRVSLRNTKELPSPGFLEISPRVLFHLWQVSLSGVGVGCLCTLLAGIWACVHLRNIPTFMLLKSRPLCFWSILTVLSSNSESSGCEFLDGEFRTWLLCQSMFSKETELSEWLYMYITRGFITLLTGCCLNSSTMAVSWWEDKEPGSCSVQEAGCLSSLSLAMEIPPRPRTSSSYPLLTMCIRQVFPPTDLASNPILPLTSLFTTGQNLSDGKFLLPFSSSFFFVLIFFFT